MDKSKRRGSIWKSVLIGVMFLVAVNFPPLSLLPVLVGVEPMGLVYHCVTAEGICTNAEIPWKVRDIDLVLRQFESYKARQGYPDLVLYRTAKQERWRFWMWFDYATSDRWELPYAERARE